ncbi:MAG: DUF2344 domain-containing protein [Clostridia bacterium]|nr:DUF2344 domain-containing protein [Clostridia bacterium]
MSVANGFYTVRLVFSKTGRARYISHLDLNRTMTRVLRRAGIPLWYTKGFNRHPYITFAAPLSLGSESLCERMDFRLTDDSLTMEEIVDRINASMPEGLRALKAAEAIHKVCLLGFAAYRMQLSCTAEELSAFLAQETIAVEKKAKKGGTKTLDIKPYLDVTAVQATENGCELTVTLPCSNDVTVNPALLTSALSAFCDREITASVLRLELYDLQRRVFV